MGQQPALLYMQSRQSKGNHYSSQALKRQQTTLPREGEHSRHSDAGQFGFSKLSLKRDTLIQECVLCPSEIDSEFALPCFSAAYKAKFPLLTNGEGRAATVGHTGVNTKGPCPGFPHFLQPVRAPLTSCAGTQDATHSSQHAKGPVRTILIPSELHCRAAFCKRCKISQNEINHSQVLSFMTYLNFSK